MNRSEQNIVERWAFMASKDLGTDRNVEAFEFADLFRQIFEEEKTEVNSKNMKYIKPFIRGFSVNNEGYYESCRVTECLDLDFIGLDKEAARDLDWELMNRKDWFMRYQYAKKI